MRRHNVIRCAVVRHQLAVWSSGMIRASGVWARAQFPERPLLFSVLFSVHVQWSLIPAGLPPLQGDDVGGRSRPGVAWASCRLPPSARSWCRPGQMWWPGVTLAGCAIWHDRSKTRHEHDPGRTRTCKLRFGGRRLTHYAMGLSEAQTTQDAR